MYVSLDPIHRRTSQTTKIIVEYAEKDNCDTRYAVGSARVPFARACTHKIAVGDGDLINVRFGPISGLNRTSPEVRHVPVAVIRGGSREGHGARRPLRIEGRLG